MDGRLITEIRTAAASAAVTNHLASSQTHVLALLGSGVQASAHWRHCGASAGLKFPCASMRSVIS